MGRVCTLATVLVLTVWIAGCVPATTGPGAGASTGQAAQALSADVIAQIAASAKPDAPAPVTLANRRIVTLRAALLGRTSADRAAGADATLENLAARPGSHVAGVQLVDPARALTVDGRPVFVIMPADLDELQGETVDAAAAVALANLQQALDAVTEANSPRYFAAAVLSALAATALFGFVVWLVRRGTRAVRGRLRREAERRAAESGKATSVLIRQTRIAFYAERVVVLAAVVVVLAAADLWISFVLRRFPYTRPWGDSVSGFLIDRLAWVGFGLIRAVPGLFTVALVVVAVRLAIRVLGFVFDAAEQGRLNLPGLYPETVTPTRKLVTALLWIFALVVAYPYLPGSSTDAFKGVSVFLGLMLSLGSSGIVNQVMSGLTVTYSRALRVGDFVRVGEVEGTVTHLGTLSTKIETPRREDVTIPNNLLISREVVNFSRNTNGTRVLVGTSVTIGYDTPWRQVHAMLIEAAKATAGLAADPAPFVLQMGLEDYYVKYTLVFSVTEPRARAVAMSALHANIQDQFNAHGVQIMSPHYEADPDAPKIVPKDRWTPPPA